MADELRQSAEKVLQLACDKNGVQAEVYLLDAEDKRIEVSGLSVENMKIAQERGLGLRIIKDGCLGYAYTSDWGEPALKLVVEQALHNAQQTQPDEYWELPEQTNAYQPMALFDEATFAVPIEDKIKLAQEMEEAAKSADKRIRLVEKAVYQEAFYRTFIMNSKGLSGEYRGSYCGIYTVALGSENQDNQTGMAMQFARKYSELEAPRIGREAAAKAVRMLGAQSIASAVLPVVLDPYIGTNFLGVLQTPFSGEAVLKGKSFYRGKGGKSVAGPLVTIIDDGSMPKRLGSAPFDGEGVPSQETVLIEQGRLTGLLHNLYTAQKSGVSSTGNSVRGSYKSTPEVGITNFYMAPGEKSPQEIIGELPKGLYVTDVMGMHTANPVSGDFSLGAAGLLIENGELTRPVKGVAIAGNLQEILMDVDAVGNDLTFFVTKGAPTLRIKAMSVSG
ncbi:MAG: TldD/PmbA family protein [Clostridia bacterium]|jgi:PmbA protein|nr:TldD/PmbA family protein [Clostridia bacterium]